MQLLIITGMSGAGKSQAANVLEDMGFYCVDNIPPRIIPAFVELIKMGDSPIKNLAICTDIRGWEASDDVALVLNSIKNDGVKYEILFLDASDDVLVRRYKENRRKHPLCDKEGISLSEAVKKERKMLSEIRQISDYILDTSIISNTQLKTEITQIFDGGNSRGFKIICRSFGFKYGADADADIVYDVRCLPNPFYVDKLKTKTGLDKEVRDYVMNSPDSTEFFKKISEFIDFAAPLYKSEGKSQLVISFGCTGGKHRSVTFAELLYAHIKDRGIPAGIIHRDINKN